VAVRDHSLVRNCHPAALPEDALIRANPLHNENRWGHLMEKRVG
jgi:hypothetical protein